MKNPLTSSLSCQAWPGGIGDGSSQKALGPPGDKITICSGYMILGPSGKKTYETKGENILLLDNDVGAR